MPDEFPMKEPKHIWQNQPTEPFKMSADEIRRKARRLQTKARIEALSWIVIGLFLSVIFARTFAKAGDLVSRLGWGLLSAWGIYGAFQAWRWIWPGKLAPDSTVATSREFYRRELERRRDYGRNVWNRSGLTFCFLGLGMVVLPGLLKSIEAPRLLLNAVPLFVLLSIWIASFIVLRKRNQRKLQREIDELDALERENG